MEEKFISVIIPNRNGSATIGLSIEAALASDYPRFEVIVVDDCSTDGSVEVIRRYPCRLVRLAAHGGASKARNRGAQESRGELLFFTDADCLLAPGALAAANRIATGQGPDAAVGGTYTRVPYDAGFFSLFQSVFVNYSELKRKDDPDYLATHALAIDARTFERAGGFAEEFMPILEDVEFSHRLRRRGYRLMMSPDILVQHIFNYSLRRSLGNAFKKTKYWIVYSLKNRDLLADSGTASVELKLNGLVFLLMALLILFGTVSGTGAAALVAAALLLAGVNVAVSKELLAAFSGTGGRAFALRAAAYYMLVYPAAIWAGTIAGVLAYFRTTAPPAGRAPQ
ncbi:MAG: glycosyltransferase [Nitrospirota bacterium]